MKRWAPWRWMWMVCCGLGLFAWLGPGTATAVERHPIGSAPGSPGARLLPGYQGTLPLNETRLLDPGTAAADPGWPVWLFLAGEGRLLEGRTARAMDLYRRLIQWAAADPYGDGWGASGVVAAAIWRYLDGAAGMESVDPEQARDLLRSIDQLENARLVSAMLAPSLLGSLPQTRAAILRGKLRLAWRIGEKDKAGQYLLERLADACIDPLDETEQAVLDGALGSGFLSQARRQLLTGACYGRNGRTGAAVVLLRAAASGEEPVAVESQLQWAAIQARSLRNSADYQTVFDLLTRVYRTARDPALAEKALYRRAFLQRRKGSESARRQFRRDLLELVDRYPKGRLADDALYRLAIDYEDAGEPDLALHTYQRLRDFPGKNDWFNLAHFKPAMLLYGQGGEHNLGAASNLLETLEAKRPQGPLHLSARFWLGRIAEQRGQPESARACFRKVVADSPYHYYAIRAAMHLEWGTKAVGRTDVTRKMRASWRDTFRHNPAFRRLGAVGPYHQRVATAVESGLYRYLLNRAHDLGRAFPAIRLEQWSLAELDGTGYLDAMILLSAYREDLFAAKDAVPSPVNRLQLAGFIGERAGDWPAAMRLVTASHESPRLRAAAQRDPHYLATAYPVVFKDSLLTAAAAHQVAPQLLYAVMRNESLFNPDALSQRRALGLFQFVPSTFAALDQRWKLLAASPHRSREAFLRDPDASIELGARWFEQELLKRNQGREIFAIMEHNAGYPAVRSWKAQWQERGKSDDVEYLLETIPFYETRLFTKRVWRDRVIVSALGLFD